MCGKLKESGLAQDERINPNNKIMPAERRSRAGIKLDGF
jgi:hypothetical protein